jgi:hypothetical protein
MVQEAGHWIVSSHMQLAISAALCMIWALVLFGKFGAQTLAARKARPKIASAMDAQV